MSDKPINPAVKQALRDVFAAIENFKQEVQQQYGMNLSNEPEFMKSVNELLASAAGAIAGGERIPSPQLVTREWVMGLLKRWLFE